MDHEVPSVASIDEPDDVRIVDPAPSGRDDELLAWLVDELIELNANRV